MHNYNGSVRSFSVALPAVAELCPSEIAELASQAISTAEDATSIDSSVVAFCSGCGSCGASYNES
jgi:hypothetical protein